MAFQIIRNDITRVHADAIVNTANPEPVCAGGTDYAIYQAAGMEQLLRARREIGRIENGRAAQTPAFRLHAKYIIHTVAPIWQGGKQGEFDILNACYENSLQLALKLKCRSVAFPLIASGVNGFPKDRALQIALSVIQPFVMEHDMKVILVVFDKQAFELSGSVVEQVRAYVDANYVSEAHRKEYAVDRVRNLLSRNRSRQTADFTVSSDLSTAIPGENRAAQAESAVTDARLEPDGLCIAAAPSEPDDQFVRNSASACGRIAAGYDLSDEAYVPENEEKCAFAPDSFAGNRTQADGQIEGCLDLSDVAFELESDEACSLAPDSFAGTGKPEHPLQASCYAPAAQPCAPAPRAKQSVPTTASAGKARVDIGAMLKTTQKTFQEKLFEMIDARGLTGPQVYKNYISKQVYSKIQADRNYHPNKFTAIALCLSLHLNLEETQDLLGRAGWALSPSNKADVVVTGCILNGEYNLVQINIILFDFDLPELEKIK